MWAEAGTWIVAPITVIVAPVPPSLSMALIGPSIFVGIGAATWANADAAARQTADARQNRVSDGTSEDKITRTSKVEL